MVGGWPGCSVHSREPTPNMSRPWGPRPLSLAASQVEYRQLGASHGRPACVQQGQMVTKPIRRQPCFSQACWWEGAGVLQKGPPVSRGTAEGLEGPSLPSAYSLICQALGSGRALFHMLGIQRGTKPSPCPDSPLRETENKYFKN